MYLKIPHMTLMKVFTFSIFSNLGLSQNPIQTMMITLSWKNFSVNCFRSQECESKGLYAVAGWAVFKERTPKACPVCLSSIVGDASTAPAHSQLTVIKSFETGGGLTHPSPAMWQAIITAESMFRTYEDQITKIENVSKFLWNSYECQIPISDFPSCHNILQSVVTRYFRLRLHIHGARITNKIASHSATQHASKSAHCRTKVT